MRRQTPLTPDEAGKLYGEHFAFKVEPDGHCWACGLPSTGRSSAFWFGVVNDLPTCDTCHAVLDGSVVDAPLELSST